MRDPEEVAFLDYAQAVVLQRRSQCVCATSEGPAWPGYLGEKYASGRVLLVGQIHHAKPPDLKPLYTAGIRRLSALLKPWALDRSASADEELLKALRESYLSSFDVWAQQTVWRGFQKIIGPRYLNLAWDQVAFTNLAKCHLPSGENVVDRVKRHEQAFPLRDLVNILNPVAVFIATHNKAIDPYVPLEAGPERIVRRYDNMHQTSQGVTIATWLGKDADEYHILQASRNARSH